MTITYNKPFFQPPSGHTAIAKSSKLWLYLVCFNSQVMKQIAYFDDLNLRWEYKISLNFTIC